jgi:uncharacterized membrane protein YccC
MTLPTREEIIFSLKCYASAMMALYIAYSIGLTRPFWAMTTVYIVSQPLAGPVRSKATYRLIGTFVGALISVASVPALANHPVLMVGFISLWIGLCLYFGVLDRTPRAYMFLMSGITVAVVGLSCVTTPELIFDLACARVEEISLGILCATVVHSLIMPRGLSRSILARLDETRADARAWMRTVLGSDPHGKTSKERHVLANDISLLRQLSTHVPFDTSSIRWAALPLTLLQDQIAAMTPLVSAIEDRLRALSEAGHELPPEVSRTLADISAWLVMDDSPDKPAEAVELRRRLAALMPAIAPGMPWHDALLVNLLARLRELVEKVQYSMRLRQDIQASLIEARKFGPKRMPTSRLLALRLHGDHALALRSALTVSLTVAICSAAWILTDWPYGASATIMATIMACLYSSLDNPALGMAQFTKLTLGALPLAAVYMLGVMPTIDTFDMMALTFFPILFMLGIFMFRPRYAPHAGPLAIIFSSMLALYGTADLGNQVAFFESGVSQTIGLTIATTLAAIIRNASPAWRALRIQKANWKELANLASATGKQAGHAYAARMLDRVGLLQTRLAAADRTASDALLDLRVGRDIIQLQRVRRRLPETAPILSPVLQGLANYYREHTTSRNVLPRDLLAHIDAALAAITTQQGRLSVRTLAIVALVGIRRDLYPDTPPLHE